MEGPPVLRATELDGDAVDIDGVLDDAAWRRASVATGFVQFEPTEGDPASERTEARVLYGDGAIYVGIRAYDSSPDSIVGQLSRRDQVGYSDLVGVVIDSYFDKRTAFHFMVNPVGVKADLYRFDDVQEDDSWDAVWDVAVTTDDQGWTAEFRIPYSQLRFRSVEEQTWGINFVRAIARRQEQSVWAPISRQDGGIVSRFGELTGLRNLDAPSRMEVMPYSLARLERAPGDPANPFYRGNATMGTVGADVKYGVTSDLTLDVTINPDFGQVEADPAQVNLSAFESFYPERRPFFVEGSGIFNFGLALGDGDDANESLFYSRRIGRTPQGRADPGDGWVDAGDQTTILGAWKLSGKTADGWSIGALHAVTQEERATVAPLSGDRYQEAIEPFTNYGMLRVQKDFREGRSALGMVATAVNRNEEVANALDLRREAYAGGVDFRHRFADDEWIVNGYLIGSHVRGSEEAIARTQRSSTHYFQRPDAGHVTFDPTRTSLSGASASFSLSKIAGGFWRLGTGGQLRTPGFETNDAGYIRETDYAIQFVYAGYDHSTAQGPFNRWRLNANAWWGWDFDGNRVSLGGNLNGSAQLRNFWFVYGGLNKDTGGYSSGMLRGGPLFKREGRLNFWSGMSSDSRKPVQGSVNAFGSFADASDAWSLGLSPSLRIRPSGRATFSVGSFIQWNRPDAQWVDRLDLTEPQYVFAAMDQTTVGLTGRLDFAFTPTLTLQLYAQPFVSAGTYTGFKAVADPTAERYADRFRPLDGRSDGGTYFADVDRDGTEDSFDIPDFDFKQFRSNAVLRWEYRPGSTLFVVWSQGRDHFDETGSFAFRDGVSALFGPDAEYQDVFMVKLSYWLGR